VTPQAGRGSVLDALIRAMDELSAEYPWAAQVWDAVGISGDYLVMPDRVPKDATGLALLSGIQEASELGARIRQKVPQIQTSFLYWPVEKIANPGAEEDMILIWEKKR
jgi:hypothetical protein